MNEKRHVIELLARIQASLPFKSAYTLKDLELALGRSEKTAYRHLQVLKQCGFVISAHAGAFTLRDSTFLPLASIPAILPSLLSMRGQRSFGLPGGGRGIARARRLLAKVGGLVTLDYAAYELTGYQTPAKFYFYPNSMKRAVDTLVSAGYLETSRGNVVLLPKIGGFSDPIQRVFCDSLAAGGRGMLDAIALIRRFPEETKTAGYLTSLIAMTLKVESDMGGSDRAIGPRQIRQD